MCKLQNKHGGKGSTETAGSVAKNIRFELDGIIALRKQIPENPVCTGKIGVIITGRGRANEAEQKRRC